MKKSKISYLLSVPLLLLVLLLAACAGEGEVGEDAADVPGGGGEPGVTEELPAGEPVPEVGVTTEAPADATEEPAGEAGATEEPTAGAPADATTEPTTEAPAGATTEPTTEAVVPGGEGGITLQVEETDLGAVLTDGEGMTLYMLDADQAGESSCYDACAEIWPPVVIASDPEIEGEEVNTVLIGIIQRTDGQGQLTYNEHPLYYYEPDEAAGDVMGHEVTDEWGMWTAVSPDGEPVTAGQGG